MGVRQTMINGFPPDHSRTLDLWQPHTCFGAINQAVLNKPCDEPLEPGEIVVTVCWLNLWTEFREWDAQAAGKGAQQIDDSATKIAIGAGERLGLILRFLLGDFTHLPYHCS